MNDELRGNFYDAVTRNGMGIEFWEKWKQRYKEFPTKPQPAEDQEEWVTQDRVPARPGIDKERWFDKCGTPTGPWEYSRSNYRRHGDTEGTDYRVELRCRRKDLPPLPEAATEDADPWVELPMDHCLRPFVDQYEYEQGFDYIVGYSSLVGVKVGSTLRKKARCRRSQLPQPKAKTRTITVPKWACKVGETDRWLVIEDQREPQFAEVHRVGETVYEVPE
jgi:hypothetical protein